MPGRAPWLYCRPAVAPRSDRYAAWIDRRRCTILIVAFVLAVIGGLAAARLELKSDPSYLLPESSEAVSSLRVIQQRARAFGRLIAVVVADDPVVRSRIACELGAKFSAISPELVARVTVDDRELRQFARAHAFLYAPLAELEQARDALRARITRDTLAANPAFISLDEDGEVTTADAADDRQLEDLRARLAEAKAAAPHELVSGDRRMQVIVVAATFPSTDIGRSIALAREAQRAIADLRAHAPHGVELGVSGDVIQVVNEQRAIEHGMIRAVIATVVLVGLVLLIYFGSLISVMSLLWTLTVGTLATFGLTYLIIGHLNSATAFLAAIVIGNGINFPVILLARHFEERRAGRHGVEALARAIEGTVRGTIAAASAAGVAYASLNVTSFRGFWHFGVIGAIGMALCWITAYTVLPAALCVLERRGLRVRRRRRGGGLLGRLVPRHPGWVVAVTLLVGGIAGGITWRYVADDPFEYNFTNLRSSGAEAEDANGWMDRIDAAFGKGMAGGFVYALDRPQDAVQIVAAVSQLNAGVTPALQLLGAPRSLADYLPPDQPRKLELLAEIRAMADTQRDRLEDEDRAMWAELRPPDDLEALQLADLPITLAQEFIERDGSRGRLMFQSQGPALEIWNGHDLVRLAQAIRSLKLPAGARVAGNALVFADLIVQIRQDGPRATLAAVLGVLLFTAIVIGMRRYGLVTVLSGALGTVSMVAACALLGLRINFLDFIALPITFGIAIDYTVNVVARMRAEPEIATRTILATTGTAVLICSLTTTIGYASLLLNDNAAIRSFGLAAIIGEATCLAAALVVAPSLLGWLAAGHRRRNASAC